MGMGCGSVANWPGLYARIFDHLRCDAWFEQLEVNFEPRCNDLPPEKGHLRFWYESLKTATDRLKRLLAHSPEKTLQWLQEAGFDRIRQRDRVTPQSLEAASLQEGSGLKVQESICR